MWHVCGAKPNFVCAAHMQYGCIVCAARVQCICTVCAARMQIYVQHTSNISVRDSSGLLGWTQEALTKSARRVHSFLFTTSPLLMTGLTRCTGRSNYLFISTVMSPCVLLLEKIIFLWFVIVRQNVCGHLSFNLIQYH